MQVRGASGPGPAAAKRRPRICCAPPLGGASAALPAWHFLRPLQAAAAPYNNLATSKLRLVQAPCAPLGGHPASLSRSLPVALLLGDFVVLRRSVNLAGFNGSSAMFVNVASPRGLLGAARLAPAGSPCGRSPPLRGVVEHPGSIPESDSTGNPTQSITW